MTSPFSRRPARRAAGVAALVARALSATLIVAGCSDSGANPA